MVVAGTRYATMGGFSYYYFGGATQVLVTANLNDASGVTGFVLLRLGQFRITINEVVTVLVAMSAYSTIPVRSFSDLLENSRMI